MDVIIVSILLVVVPIILIISAIKSHTELDKEEEKFKYGNIVEIVGGFFSGKQGIITRLHPATSLSHGWVGYWVKFENGEETPEAINVEFLKEVKG